MKLPSIAGFTLAEMICTEWRIGEITSFRNFCCFTYFSSLKSEEKIKESPFHVKCFYGDRSCYHAEDRSENVEII